MIFLVRHCHYDNPDQIQPGRLGVELSQLGLAQANNLRHYFEDIQLHEIYSSPVTRCKQTVALLEKHEVRTLFDIRLAEVLSAIQGAPHRDQWRMQLYGRVNQLGGESPQDVQDRVSEFWHDHFFDSRLNYLICSHGDPLYFLYQHLLGEKAFSDLTVLEPAGYQPQGSIRIISWEEEGWAIERTLMNEELS